MRLPRIVFYHWPGQGQDGRMLWLLVSGQCESNASSDAISGVFVQTEASTKHANGRIEDSRAIAGCRTEMGGSKPLGPEGRLK